ncbi:hypothetical protein [Streptomyces sp. WG5]|uniref:hypothetical protein n=1 Tax=Streptomyces sp. WG5 TaxID=3417648 RepID=UPI003CF87798
MTAARKTSSAKTSALAAKQAEATHDEKNAEAPKTATFDYKGFTYTVPADPLDIPMEVAFAESEFEIIQEIVGPDQWVEFRKTRPTIRQFGEFSDLVLKASGQGGAEDEGN